MVARRPPEGDEPASRDALVAALGTAAAGGLGRSAGQRRFASWQEPEPRDTVLSRDRITLHGGLSRTVEAG